MTRVSNAEVLDLLRAVGKGECIPHLKDPALTWKAVYAGEVAYAVGGWQVSVFNDCDSWDYIDSVEAPDGRTGEYEDWYDEGGESPQPDDLLYAEDAACYQRMQRAFIEAS